jgi:site-specific DNA recombinase
MFREMKKAYIYARFSDEDRARSNTDRSIDTQVKVCYEYAKSRDIEVISKFTDEGKSGTSVTKRKGLQSLLERIKTFPVGYLLVYDIDRLARNTLDYLELKQ